MFRKYALSILITLALPVAAQAGGGGVPSEAVAPVLGSNGASAVVLAESAGGFIYGYQMDGLVIGGEGPLNQLPGYEALTGGFTGWPDLDGNGITDLVVVSDTGFLVGYLFEADGDGFTVLQTAAIPATLPAGNTVLGWPDLNGDGNSDLVFQDDSTGATTAVLMDGLSISSSGALPGLPASGGYRTIGFPDLNGDGRADVVIQAASGFSYAYLTSANGIDNFLDGTIPGPPTAAYRTAGFPDLNGDGAADIVIQEAGGYAYAYLMAADGLNLGPDGPVSAIGGYNLIGFPQLGGPVAGGDDLVLQSTSGFTIGILMNGGVSTQPAVGMPSLQTSNGYSVLGFPNLDGDDQADLVWQQSGGFTYGYVLDGTSAESQNPLPTRPAGYENLTWATKTVQALPQ